MTPQEREVINGIFDRLKGAANQQRDPEAERHIADLVRQQPYATYALAQSVYVQEQALGNMQSEIQQLQAQIGQLQQSMQQQAQQQQSGGFLSGLFGGGAARPQAAPQPGPWARSAQQGMAMAPHEVPPAAGPWGRPGAAAPAAPAGGSSFLGSALTTAAGVAGGMVVGNMLMNAFKGSPTSTASTAAAEPGQASAADQSMLAQAEAYDAGYDDADASDDGGGDTYEA